MNIFGSLFIALLSTKKDKERGKRAKLILSKIPNKNNINRIRIILNLYDLKIEINILIKCLFIVKIYNSSNIITYFKSLVNVSIT